MSQYSEFYVIWKVVRQVEKFSLCKIVEIKIGGKTRFENLLVNNYSIRPCWI